MIAPDEIETFGNHVQKILIENVMRMGLFSFEKKIKMHFLIYNLLLRYDSRLFSIDSYLIYGISLFSFKSIV